MIGKKINYTIKWVYNLAFKIENEQEKVIAEKFNVKNDVVSTLNTHYEKFLKPGISLEYLSHVVSALEKIARGITENPLFIINLEPIDNSFSVCSSKYAVKRFFTVYYPKDADDLQKRVGIAHELGHLYLLLRLDTDNLDGDEVLCSIFSILAIADRCYFYQEKSKEYIHSSLEHLIGTMALLHNTKNGKKNIS